MTREARETVALMLGALVVAFVLGTLIVLFILALNGVEVVAVWDALFGLVLAIMSALGGWLVGSNTHRTEE